MKKITKQMLGLLTFIGLSSPIFAGDKEDLIVNKAVDAYGGKSFLSLKGMSIEDKYKGFRYGQSTSPTEPDIQHNHYTINVDIKNKRKEFQWLRGEGDDISTQHLLFNGKQGYRINHTTKTMYEQNAITFASAERRHLFLLDTAIVQLINGARETVEFLGTEMHQGELHNKLSFKHENTPEMTVYLHAETGLISTMTRKHWRDGLFRYHYSNVKTIEQIKFAHNTYVTRGGKPFEVLTDRKVIVNPSFTDDFILPKDYKGEGKALNFPDMLVKQLSKNIYLAGKDWGFSIFYDAGDYYVASGGYEDLTTRFNEVISFTGKDKPLKYQVVTHHHLDHLGGMNEAEQLGVIFVTAKSHAEKIRSMVDQPLADDRFLFVDSTKTIANNMVKVIDFPNGHAANHLNVYFEEAKVLFTADTYLSRQEEGSPDGHDGLAKLKATLAKANVDPDFFAAAHSGRVLTKRDFSESLQKRTPPEICPLDWNICQDR
ncbi:MAG: hypothetical protein HRT53_05490 [Colwellia sp.]|nr:hypothetical protein [Colwellia sp.]